MEVSNPRMPQETGFGTSRGGHYQQSAAISIAIEPWSSAVKDGEV